MSAVRSWEVWAGTNESGRLMRSPLLHDSDRQVEEEEGEDRSKLAARGGVSEARQPG